MSESIYEYNSLEQPIEEILFREKGSRFITYAYRVMDEESIRQRLDQVRGIHPKATHHCYAWRLGITGENYRANDDGEPSGSAGIPIYNQILAHQLTFCLIIVVRYYGGVKLGVGGLIRAYKEAAKLALDTASIQIFELTEILHFRCPFHIQNSVFQLFNRYQVQIMDIQSTYQLEIKAQVSTKFYAALIDQLSQIHLLEWI